MKRGKEKIGEEIKKTGKTGAERRWKRRKDDGKENKKKEEKTFFKKKIK